MVRHQGGSWFPVDTNATIWCFLSKNVQDLPLQKLLLGFIIAKIHYSTSHHKGWFDIDTAPSLVIAEVYHCINDSPQYLFVTVFDTNKYMIPWDCITKQLDKNRILIIKMICFYSKNSKQNFKKDFWRAKLSHGLLVQILPGLVALINLCKSLLWLMWNLFIIHDWMPWLHFSSNNLSQTWREAPLVSCGRQESSDYLTSHSYFYSVIFSAIFMNLQILSSNNSDIEHPLWSWCG